MIADLKADSSRWDDERSRPGGQPSNGIRDSNGNFRKSNAPVVGYRDSTTHQSRQYYGPTEAAVATPTGGYPPSSAAGGAPPQEVYSQGYGPGQNYGQNNPAYGGPSAGYGGPHQPDGGNYYVAGAAYGNLNHQPSSEPDPRGGRNGPLPPAQSVPRGGAGYPSQAPTSYPESRGNAGGYYAPPGPGGQAPSQYPPHPGDAYYGRQSKFSEANVFHASLSQREVSNCLGPAVAGYGDPADSYPDSRPYEQPQYSQGPMSSSTTATANQGAPRRGGGDRERDSDPRDRQHRPHGSSRPHGGRN
jgi:hypothetical protein